MLLHMLPLDKRGTSCQGGGGGGGSETLSEFCHAMANSRNCLLEKYLLIGQIRPTAAMSNS